MQKGVGCITDPGKRDRIANSDLGRLFGVLQFDFDLQRRFALGQIDDDERVRAVMLDMRYNLGHRRFRTFKKMIRAVKEFRYKDAAEEMRDSKWCGQVKSRCDENYRLVMEAWNDQRKA